MLKASGLINQVANGICQKRNKNTLNKIKMTSERRSVLKKLFASLVGVTGLGVVANAKGIESSLEKVVGNVTSVQNVPMFSGHVIHNRRKRCPYSAF